MRPIPDPRPGEILRISMAVTDESDRATDINVELMHGPDNPQVHYSYEISAILAQLAAEFRNVYTVMANKQN